MTHEDYRDALARLGLTQVEAARFFRVTDRTSRRWASGECDVPRAVEIVFWLMFKFKVKPEKIPDYTNPGD